MLWIKRKRNDLSEMHNVSRSIYIYFILVWIEIFMKGYVLFRAVHVCNMFVSHLSIIFFVCCRCIASQMSSHIRLFTPSNMHSVQSPTRRRTCGFGLWVLHILVSFCDSSKFRCKIYRFVILSFVFKSLSLHCKLYIKIFRMWICFFCFQSILVNEMATILCCFILSFWSCLRSCDAYWILYSRAFKGLLGPNHDSWNWVGQYDCAICLLCNLGVRHCLCDADDGVFVCISSCSSLALVWISIWYFFLIIAFLNH